MTVVQSTLNALHAFQDCEGFQLGGKGPALKKLAAEIKGLFPTLNHEDKTLFVAAISRGRFNINKDIWNLFLDAVGSSAPAPAPAPAPAATNKVAGEILETCNSILKAVKAVSTADPITISKMAEDVEIIYAICSGMKEALIDLQKQVAELKRPAPRRGAKAKVEDMIDMPV